MIGKGCLLRDFLFGFSMAMGVMAPLSAASDEPTTMILATVGTSRAEVKIVDGRVREQNPGWFVELSRKAAAQCGGKADFAFMPWARALDMVMDGKIAAAYNSSYKAERAKFGVYPRKDGALDENRASRRYAYYAYVRKHSSDLGLRERGEVAGRLIGVERKSSIIPVLKKRGAELFGTADYLGLLRLVTSDRVDAVVGIGHDFDGVLERHPELATALIRVEPPIQKKVGYVMFSKIFYRHHSALVECFWSTSANLREIEWYKTTYAKYQ